jgi:hypothetical protein
VVEDLQVDMAQVSVDMEPVYRLLMAEVQNYSLLEEVRAMEALLSRLLMELWLLPKLKSRKN